jgi:hypothetical protein
MVMVKGTRKIFMLVENIVRKTLGLKRHLVDRVRDGNGELALYLIPDRGHQLIRSGCAQKGSGYDTLRELRRSDVPVRGIPVELVSATKRIDCRGYEVKVEEIPRAQGKSPL